MRQQGNEANEEQPVTRHRGTKAVEEEQATQDEARGLKRPNWWNPLRRWLNELPTPDFNLKIKLYEK